MKNVLLIICFFLLTFNLIYASNNQDVIILKDGTTLKGEILEENKESILIKTSLGEIRINREKIKNNPVIIHLKDGNIIKGNLIRKNDISLKIESSLGIFEIKLTEINKIVEDIDESEVIEKDKSEKIDNEAGLKAIGNAFLYQQRKKNISTAIGFQALGAGLLYSEKYTLGAIMLIAENGLLISGAFVEDPEIVPYLWISGLVLKGVNTIFTITSVNDYNNRLAVKMGIIDDNEIRFKTHKGYFYIAPNGGLGFAYEDDIALGGTIGWGSNNFGRIGANFTGGVINQTSINLTLQYEKPLSTESFLCFTPKFGAGYISDRYSEKGEEYS